MEEQKPTPPAPQPTVPAVKATPPKRYALDGKDRALLPLSLLLGILFVELLVTCFWYMGGLVVPVLVAAWYGVLFWYRGWAGLNTRASVLLMAATLLLALTFGLYSNEWFRLWNLLALPCLMGVQFFEMTGTAHKPWHAASMLWERFALTLRGLFRTLGAPVQAAASLKKSRSKRGLYVLAGLAASILLLVVVVPMLLSADALFRHIAGGFTDFLDKNLGNWGWRLLAGACVAPFLYGLLYALRRPEPLKGRAGVRKTVTLDAAAPITVLVVMDALYLFFLAVQFAALFGGPQYLAAAGISYAEYARSGFFQLVFIAVLNLALVMGCLQFSDKAGRGWRVVKLLSTALVAASCVMLASAAYRMTLYVGVYGLSIDRFLTYWGMVMLGIFFTAALLKIWRAEFSFFKLLFAAGVAGWLLLNFINMDYLVARYNVSLYERHPETQVDVFYLAHLSYDTLHVLEALPGDMPVNSGYTLDELIGERRMAAARDASDWRTWSVSAQLAAIGKD